LDAFHAQEADEASHIASHVNAQVNWRINPNNVEHILQKNLARSVYRYGTEMDKLVLAEPKRRPMLESVLCWIVGRDKREEILGDIGENFKDICVNKDVKIAQLQYNRDVRDELFHQFLLVIPRIVAIASTLWRFGKPQP
jgi:hypothetical protein